MLDAMRRFLPMADKVVPRRTSLKVLENICIDDGTVRATDLEISIGMKIDSEASCLIPLAIAKIIVKSKPATVSCQRVSDDRLRIDYGHRSVEFTLCRHWNMEQSCDHDDAFVDCILFRR